MPHARQRNQRTRPKVPSKVPLPGHAGQVGDVDADIGSPSETDGAHRLFIGRQTPSSKEPEQSTQVTCASVGQTVTSNPVARN